MYTRVKKVSEVSRDFFFFKENKSWFGNRNLIAYINVHLQKSSLINLFTVAIQIFISIWWFRLSLVSMQCENGHISCSPCSTKLKNRCASCCSITAYRNTAVGKILVSVIISCQNAMYGCKSTMTYQTRHDHETDMYVFTVFVPPYRLHFCWFV